MAPRDPEELEATGAPASALLQRNLLIYGLGGLVAPFVFIKLIDVVIVAMGVK